MAGKRLVEHENGDDEYDRRRDVLHDADGRQAQQLGAIGVWMQFTQNREQAIEKYCTALSLGGTKTLPELYAAAGLDFDFSPQKIKRLVEFVQEQLERIEN